MRLSECVSRARRILFAAISSVLLPAVFLPFLTGCPPRREEITPAQPPESPAIALARINQNLAQIQQPVQYDARVSFRFKDAEGKTRNFPNHDAALVFAAPRNLRLDIRSLSGVIAQFGSNEERYWLWIEPEVKKLWWGTWANLERGAAERLAVPPDDLIDVLMLRPLKATDPLLRRVGEQYWLFIAQRGPDGRTLATRELRIDLRQHFMPLEITDTLPDGRVRMHATLENYRRMGDSGPWTPRAYHVRWPIEEAEMRLRVDDVKLRPELPLDVFEFPAEWQGAQEALDRTVQ